MNISSIPEKPYYPVERSIQSASGQIGEKQSANSGPRLVEVKHTTFAASDKDYNKEEAILNRWFNEGIISLDDVMNGVKVKLKSPNPSAEELQELEKRLQTEGFPKEVDWSGLNFDLLRIGFDPNRPASAIGEDDLSRKTNYLASRYVAVEDKILKEASRSEQAEQLAKLDEVYQKALYEIAEGYSGIVGSYLEKNGVSVERQKIYDSIVSGMESKIEAYRKVLPGNAELESLKGTADEWLLGDDAYVASVLRASASGVNEASRTKSDDVPYTMEELEIFGQYVSSLSKMDGTDNRDINNTVTRDESRLGVEYALLAVKTDKLSNSGRVGDAMSELLKKTMDGFMRSFLERVDEKLSARRAKCGAPGDTKGFAALDRSIIVWDVYQYTMQEY